MFVNFYAIRYAGPDLDCRGPWATSLGGPPIVQIGVGGGGGGGGGWRTKHVPFSRSIRANHVSLNVWGSGYYIIASNRAGKRARSLFNCISVTDGISKK